MCLHLGPPRAPNKSVVERHCECQGGAAKCHARDENATICTSRASYKLATGDHGLRQVVSVQIEEKWFARCIKLLCNIYIYIYTCIYIYRYIYIYECICIYIYNYIYI